LLNGETQKKGYESGVYCKFLMRLEPGGDSSIDWYGFSNHKLFQKRSGESYLRYEACQNGNRVAHEIELAKRVGTKGNNWRGGQREKIGRGYPSGGGRVLDHWLPAVQREKVLEKDAHMLINGCQGKTQKDPQENEGTTLPTDWGQKKSLTASEGSGEAGRKRT